MSTEPWPPIGSIVTFDATPSTLAHGLPLQEPGTRLQRFAGEVVGNQPMKPYGTGAIPTRAVSIRGRVSKKVVVVDGAGTDLKEWPSWTEADKACQDFNT